MPGNRKNGNIWEEDRFEDISSSSRRPASRGDGPHRDGPRRDDFRELPRQEEWSSRKKDLDFELFSERRPRPARQPPEERRNRERAPSSQRDGQARRPRRRPPDTPEWNVPPRDRTPRGAPPPRGGPSRGTSRGPRPAPEPRKRPKKPLSRRARRAILGFTLLSMIVVTALLAIFLLFKVSDIQITGDAIEGVGQEEVLRISGCKTGENLFFLSTRSREDKLKEQIPYLEEAQLIRHFPGTLEIRLTKAQAASSVQSGTSWLYVSAGGKILEIQPTPKEGTVRIAGLPVQDPQVGRQIWPDEDATDDTSAGSGVASSESASSGESAPDTASADAESARVKRLRNARAAYEEILQTLIELDLASQVSWLDFSDLTDIRMLYQDRIVFRLGAAVKLGYKVQFGCLEAVPRLGEQETGVLDLSSADETSRAIFTNSPVDADLPGGTASPDGSAALPSGSAALPTPSPSPAPEDGDTGGRGGDIPDTPYTGE